MWPKTNKTKPKCLKSGYCGPGVLQSDLHAETLILATTALTRWVNSSVEAECLAQRSQLARAVVGLEPQLPGSGSCILSHCTSLSGKYRHVWEMISPWEQSKVKDFFQNTLRSCSCCFSSLSCLPASRCMVVSMDTSSLLWSKHRDLTGYLKKETSTTERFAQSPILCLGYKNSLIKLQSAKVVRTVGCQFSWE